MLPQEFPSSVSQELGAPSWPMKRAWKHLAISKTFSCGTTRRPNLLVHHVLCPPGPALYHKVSCDFSTSDIFRAMFVTLCHFTILSLCLSAISLSSYTSSQSLCSSCNHTALSSVKLPSTYNSVNGFFSAVFCWHQSPLDRMSGPCFVLLVSEGLFSRSRVSLCF